MHLADHIEDAAEEAAGNWRKFQSFAWHAKPDEPDDWAIFYTHNRDSSLADESNAAVFKKTLQPFLDEDEPDVVSERHSHWACGWVEGYAIRVYDAEGEVTKAFAAYAELALALQEYPILDESDYSEREFEAALKNIEDIGYSIARDELSAEEWAPQVWDWLWNNDQGELENTDGDGAWPSESSVRTALEALGLAEEEDEDVD